jgi:UTP--glucose-1-phosphate uridylyltransferase
MKGIIVAAGYGTRFLPATKTIAKEMLPLIDKPSIAFIVEEFIQSGITDIIIISSRRKKSMEDYLDREVELEELFKREGAQDKLDKIKPYPANFTFIRQQKMMGTGHALLQVKPWLQGESAVVAYPDDLHMGDIPLAKQLIDLHKQTQCSVMASIHNPPHLERYGVLDIDDDGLHVKGMVEKPPVGQAPSKEVSIGRFLFTADFFEYLEEGWKKHSGGEYYHLYGLERLMEEKTLVYKQIDGERLDTGEPSGFLRALLKYASNFPDLRQIIKEESADL